MGTVPLMILLKKQDVTAQKPRFEGRLIPITAVLNATGHNDSIYPWKLKMIVALGMDNSDCDLSALPSNDSKSLCSRALEHLLKQSSEFRAKHALEFEELLVKSLNFKFDTIKSL